MFNPSARAKLSNPGDICVFNFSKNSLKDKPLIFSTLDPLVCVETSVELKTNSSLSVDLLIPLNPRLQDLNELSPLSDIKLFPRQL